MHPDLSWNSEKDEWLRRERGVSFADVEAAMLDGRVLADKPHPNTDRFPHQRIMIVEIRRETYVVPYVTNSSGLFLKTIYPSRKARRLHGEAKAAQRN